MNKQEYLSELEAHLASLSEEERTNALQFYEEYFEDAGSENEQQVISELGKPFALAKSIICEQSAYSKSKSFANYKASISANYNSTPAEEIEPDVAPDAAPQQPHTQYTAYNYGDTNSSSSADSSDDKVGSYDRYKESYGGNSTADNNSSNDTYNSSNNTAYDTSYKRGGSYSGSSSVGKADTAGLVLFILLIVFVIAPVVITIGFIAIGFFIGALGCLIGLLVSIVLSIIKVSAFHLGASLVCAGVVMILLPLATLLAVKLIPKIVKWTVNTVRKLSGGVI